MTEAEPKKEETTMEATIEEPVKEEATKEEEPSSEPAGPPKEEQPTAEALEGVKERLKFFFSDANLRQDRFLRRFLWKDHGVPVEVLLRFNSLKTFTTSASTVITVAQEIPELVVFKDKQIIERKEPFLYSQMNDHVPLSLSITGLKVENERFTVSTANLKKHFDMYNGVALVKLCMNRVEERATEGPHRYKWRNVASGNAFVEFDTVENLETAAAELLTIKDKEPVEPKRVLEIDGVKLGVQKLAEVDVPEDNNTNKRKSYDKKPEPPKTPFKPFEVDWKPGCVIQLKGLSDTCDRESILETVGSILHLSMDDVKDKKIFADFSRGQTDGAIRFSVPDDVPKVLEALKTKEIAGSKVEAATVLEGDVEKEYWDKFIAFKNEQRKQQAEERSHKKRRNR